MAATILRGTDKAGPAGDRSASPAKLGRAPNETVTLCSDASGKFRCVARPNVNRAAEVVAQYKDANCWFGVNPVRPLADGRGKAADITRLAAVPADLDFDENKCGSPDIAFKVLEDLSTIVGLPAAITGSGHGLQPFWTISDGEIMREFTTTQATALLARVHALVADVADHHGAKVDNVFDLPRVMRVPDTVNTKPGQKPVTAVCFDGRGAPLTVRQLTAILDERGIPEEPPRLERRSSACRSHARGNRQPGSSGIDDYLTEGEMSPKVLAQLAPAMDHCHALSLRGMDGSRHGNIRDDVLALVGLGKRGEPGVSGAIKLLRAEFIEQVGSDRGYDAAAREFDSFLDPERLKERLDDGQNGEDNPFDGDPIPLTHRVDIPEFPVDALPAPYAEMVNAISEFTQTDPAMPATSALSVLSACNGGRAEIEIRPGWREPLNEYFATIAVSGERKSAVQSAMTRPLFDVEERLAATARDARRDAEEHKHVAMQAVDRQRRVAARAVGTDDEESTMAVARDLAAMAESIEVPEIPRLVADDVTPEAAGTLLAQQGGRLAIISAEGGVFDIIAGRYNHNVPNMDLWLKGHAGDPLKVDRKGRPPEYIRRPALTLGLMIQPAVLTTIAANQQFRGRGFLARILYSYPVSRVGRRDVRAPSPEQGIVARYSDAVQQLARGMAEWTDPAVLTLTDAAQQAVVAIAAAVEPMLLPGEGELCQLADWGNKYVGAVARIAGNLHLSSHGSAEGPRKAVEEKTILAAARIGEYFKACAINAFAEMGTDRATADAVYLLDRIAAMGADEVSERDLFTGSSRGRFKSMSEVRGALRCIGSLSTAIWPRCRPPGRLAVAPHPRATGSIPPRKPQKQQGDYCWFCGFCGTPNPVNRLTTERKQPMADITLEALPRTWSSSSTASTATSTRRPRRVVRARRAGARVTWTATSSPRPHRSRRALPSTRRSVARDADDRRGA